MEAGTELTFNSNFLDAEGFPKAPVLGKKKKVQRAPRDTSVQESRCWNPARKGRALNVPKQERLSQEKRLLLVDVVGAFA